MVKDRLQSFINRTIRNSFVELNGDLPVEIDFYNERPKYYDKEFQRSYILKYFYAYIIEYYEAYSYIIEFRLLEKAVQSIIYRRW